MLPITVAFASDDGYAPYLLVAVSSFLNHLPADRVATVVVMDGGISAYYKDRLQEIVQSGHSRASLRFLPVAELDAQLDAFFSRRGNKGRVTAWSYTAYYRLFLSSLLPDCSRLLYLDVDVLICDDLSKLIDLDMQGKSVGTVQDVSLCCDLSTKAERARLSSSGHDMNRYFNSGIMLIDLDKWRAVPSFIDKVEEVFCALPDLMYPDQDILNYMFRDDMICLEKRWNFLTTQIESNTLPPECAEYRDDIVKREAFGIIHYAGVKPWKDAESCPLASYWWREARRAGVEGDIIRREMQLVRKYLLAKAGAPRAGSLKLQIFVLKLKLLMTSGDRKVVLKGRLQRLEEKLRKAQAARRVRLK